MPPTNTNIDPFRDDLVKVLRFSAGDKAEKLQTLLDFGGKRAALILAFVPPEMNFPVVSNVLTKCASEAPIVAVSTAGELCEDPFSPGDLYLPVEAERKSLVLQTFSPDLISAVSIHAIPLHNEDIRGKGAPLSRRERVSRIKSSLAEVSVPFPIDCRDTLALAFIDGLSACESYFMEAVYQSGRFPCPFAGGSAGGSLDFSGTQVFDGTAIRENHAVVAFLKLSDGKRFSILKSQNFHRTNTSFVVLKADPDHRTVSTVVDPESLTILSAPMALAEAVGCHPSELESRLADHTFGINIEGEIFIRSVAGIDWEKETVSFYCDVNPGDRLYLLDKLDFAEQTRSDYWTFLKGKQLPVGGILNDCILRRLNNASHLNELNGLWRCPVAGYSTFGEMFGINVNQTLSGIFFFDVGHGEDFPDPFIDNFPVHYGRFYNYFTTCRLNRIELLTRLRTSDLLTDQFAEMRFDSEEFGIIAAQARTEKALRANQARLEAITSSLFDGVLLVDGSGAVTFANHAARNLLGTDAALPIPVDELVNVVVEDQAISFATLIVEKSLSRRETFANADAVFQTASGERFSVSYAIAPTREETDVGGAVISFHSIEALKLAQKEAQLASRLASVGQLAAGIAHEINTPIQYVGDNLRFILKSLNDVSAVFKNIHRLIADKRLLPEDEEYLRQALARCDLDYLMDELPTATSESLEGAERVAHIVRSMKEFSHPGSNTKSMTDLNRAIESTVTISRNEWKSVANLELDLDPHLSPINCFAADINQVFLNLIVNAAQAIAETKTDPNQRGVIHVFSRQSEDGVEIRIRDSGPGVPTAIRSRIFDPFFTTKAIGKGTGQGLSMCFDTVVRKHGGKIYLNEAISSGTEFVVFLPIDAVDSGKTDRQP